MVKCQPSTKKIFTKTTTKSRAKESPEINFLFRPFKSGEIVGSCKENIKRKKMLASRKKIQQKRQTLYDTLGVCKHTNKTNDGGPSHLTNGAKI